MQLRCTTAGTTSSSLLDCSSKKAGNSITDGSVVWTVESIGAQYANASHTHDYAAASHNHSASNITSGTLPIARGGTGQTSAAAVRNALGLGNTTGALPIANGGTGATTAAAARANLGIKDIATEGSDYIVETYQNGTEWYRKYASGWVEQGGFLTTNAVTQITLLKPYANTNYGIQITGEDIYLDTNVVLPNIMRTDAYPKTTTSFYVYAIDARVQIDTISIYWACEGQGA